MQPSRSRLPTEYGFLTSGGKADGASTQDGSAVTDKASIIVE